MENPKKPIYQRKWFIAICIIFVISSIGNMFSKDDSEDDSEQSSMLVSNIIQSSEDISEQTLDISSSDESNLNDKILETEVIIYNDPLQQLYIDIKSTMSYNEVLTLVANSGLEYIDHDVLRGRIIKVANDKGVTPLKYADRGDYE